MAAPTKHAAKKPAGGKAKKAGKKQSDLYAIAGDKIQRKNRSCPKCGPGVFMAAHTNRLVCGKCKYTEFKKN